MSDIAKNHSKNLNNCSAKIMLSLNSDEHARLIGLIASLTSKSKINSDSEYKNLESLCKLTIKESQSVLKEEWGRVKKGEASIFLTKYVLIAVLPIIGFLVISMLFFM